jgi:hypothetical protein
MRDFFVVCLVCYFCNAVATMCSDSSCSCADGTVTCRNTDFSKFPADFRFPLGKVLIIAPVRFRQRYVSCDTLKKVSELVLVSRPRLPCARYYADLNRCSSTSVQRVRFDCHFIHLKPDNFTDVFAMRYLI